MSRRIVRRLYRMTLQYHHDLFFIVTWYNSCNLWLETKFYYAMLKTDENGVISLDVIRGIWWCKHSPLPSFIVNIRCIRVLTWYNECTGKFSFKQLQKECDNGIPFATNDFGSVKSFCSVVSFLLFKIPLYTRYCLQNHTKRLTLMEISLDRTVILPHK